ncbi:aminoglycoside phosphotransferase family protein [Streptacidiphilus pinicola]|uniref:Aminoglycoside phosphotransferase family protein n=1 Tax=Streptacidiphilus pinicola TaxID=2219663 RepID=A0A2X0K888_9ACTN|nr:aminoglycoside phosphotransferase family protein [Streptacidiphilus pinicola]RAG83420.1 aminoglycoside phosphotransferase family protein [Streptacidiphilus pinicola]
MGSRPPFGDGLRAELGTPCRARRLGSSPRSRVWRAELSGVPVVVKQLVDGPEADERYAREVAALTLASRVDPPVVPRLLGTEPVERVLVLEHVTEQQSGEDRLVEYASTLARLHASATAAAGIDGPLPAWSGPGAADIKAFLGLAARLGVAETTGVRDELAALVQRLAETPGRLALLHGDPCPGNDLYTTDGVRFIDFEQASLGNGLMELAYLRIGFPTCWCVSVPPPDRLDAAESAYRCAWREATGTEVQGDLLDACASWLLRGDALVPRARRGTEDQLARLPRRDWWWGSGTARQRLAHRLDVVGRMSAEAERLPALGRLSTALRAAMLDRWPTLGPFPAERSEAWRIGTERG